MDTFLHGTSSAQAETILADGFDLEAQRRSDPGDFGWGVYLTDRASRARAYGERVLQVTIDPTRFARITNPYFLKGLEEVEPVTDVEKLFHGVAFRGGQMLVVKADSEERVAIARRIREAFIGAGYDGIIAGPDSNGQCEVVVFRTEAIVSVENSTSADG